MTTRGCLATDAGSGGGGGGGGGGTPGTIVPVALTNGTGEDTADRTDYHTDVATSGGGTVTLTQGVATFITFLGTFGSGSPDPSSVACSNGDSTANGKIALLAGIPTAATQNNKCFTYVHIPTTGGAGMTYTVSYGATVMLQCQWIIWQAPGAKVDGGLNQVYIPDSTRAFKSGTNGTHLHNKAGVLTPGTGFPCQQQWHANNVTVLVGCAGSGNLSITPGAGQTQIATQGTNTATTTIAISYATGTQASMDMTWIGSFSQHGHVFELRAANTGAPPLGASLLVAFQSTNWGTANTTASVTPAAGSMLVMGVVNAKTAAVADPTSISGTLSATWTHVTPHVGFNPIATPTELVNIFYSTDASGSGTITVNQSSAQDGGVLIVIQITGQAGSGQIPQHVEGSADATNTTPTVTMGAFGNANDGVLAFIGSNTNTAGAMRASAGVQQFTNEEAITSGSGEVSCSTPSTFITAVWCHGNVATLGGTLGAGTLWGEQAVEVKAA